VSRTRRATGRGGPLVSIIAALGLVLAACAGGGSDGDAEADSETDEAASGEEVDTDAAAEFFEGETVTLVVPFSPGGGYDSYARMIAPVLEDELGATVVVENRDGAGGLLAINELTTDDSDGLRIAIMNAVGVSGATVAGADGAAFGLDDVSYIGRVGSSPHLWATGADSEFDEVEDVIESGAFTFCSTGPGAADFVLPSLLSAIFDLDGAEIVTGFEGSSENELAVTRGDVDGMTGDYDSRIAAVEDGDHRPLLVVGQERVDDTPDTPTIYELELDEEQESLVDATVAMIEMGRPLVASPSISEENLAYLRETLQRTMEREELIEESENTERPLNYLSGEEMDELAQDILDAPELFQQTLAEAF
jgi:tripartite-type tricarboxylate transporter receptor subunit TctC